MGCRDNGLAYAIGSQLFSTQEALVKFGSADQQQRWLSPLIDGSCLASFALTEPEIGSDAYHLSTSAERRADGQGPDVAHEDLCRVGVEPQEAEARAGQRSATTTAPATSSASGSASGSARPDSAIASAPTPASAV